MEYDEDEDEDLFFSEIDLKISNANEEFFSCTGRKLINVQTSLINKKNVNLNLGNNNFIIPYGAFFYPCSGKDFEEPISIFKNAVSEFHFSDPFKPLKKNPENTDSPKLKDKIYISELGNIILHDGSSQSFNYQGSEIFSHQKDGLLTFVDDIKSISVFFYRGDSQGEGGSGQYWLGPVLIDLVLSKIEVGGLICADGSNSFGCTSRKFQSLKIGEEFSYRNLVIKRLAAEIPGKQRPMYVLQVNERS